jgi:flagellar biogenesis protein FliO
VWQIGKTAVALAAVCALLYVFVRYGLRRLAGSGREAEGLFRVVARFGLEPKKMLYVVEVSGKTVLLGSSETGVRFLAELDGGPIRRAAEAGPAQPRLTGPGPGGAFYQLLQRKLDRPAMERPGVESRPAAPGAIREDVS